MLRDELVSDFHPDRLWWSCGLPCGLDPTGRPPASRARPPASRPRFLSLVSPSRLVAQPPADVTPCSPWPLLDPIPLPPLPLQPPPKKPNIVVIFGDDIGQTNISAYSKGLMGYRTPNIDRIAREGMIFTDYYAEQSCTAGRSSFITGQCNIPGLG